MKARLINNTIDRQTIEAMQGNAPFVTGLTSWIPALGADYGGLMCDDPEQYDLVLIQLHEGTWRWVDQVESIYRNARIVGLLDTTPFTWAGTNRMHEDRTLMDCPSVLSDVLLHPEIMIIYPHPAVVNQLKPYMGDQIRVCPYPVDAEGLGRLAKPQPGRIAVITHPYHYDLPLHYAALHEYIPRHEVCIYGVPADIAPRAAGLYSWARVYSPMSYVAFLNHLASAEMVIETQHWPSTCRVATEAQAMGIPVRQLYGDDSIFPPLDPVPSHDHCRERLLELIA